MIHLPLYLKSKPHLFGFSGSRPYQADCEFTDFAPRGSSERKGQSSLIKAALSDFSVQQRAGIFKAIPRALAVPSPQHAPSLAACVPLCCERCLTWRQMGHRDEIRPHRLMPEQFSALKHSHARHHKEPADGLAKPMSGFTLISHGVLWPRCLLFSLG